MARIVRGPSAMMSLPLDGNGSDIVDGALITRGITAGTDLGVFIVSAATTLDVVGCLVGIHNFSEVGDSAPEAAAAHVLGEVELALPGAIIAIEYDQTDTMTGNTGTTLDITIGSLEDNIDSSWLYIVAGDAAGDLRYIDTSTGGAATITTAPSTAISSTDTIIKILRRGHSLFKLNTNRDGLGTDVAAGTATLRCLDNQIRHVGSAGWESLDPTKHGALEGLNTPGGVAFRSLVTLEDSHFTPVDTG